MHYSKDYYTKAKERIDKLQKEFADHNTPSSKTDPLQEAEQNDPSFEKIMARIRKMEQQTMHVVNPEKLNSFFLLMDMARELAEYCEMNRCDRKIVAHTKGMQVFLLHPFCFLMVPCFFSIRHNLSWLAI